MDFHSLFFHFYIYLVSPLNYNIEDNNSKISLLENKIKPFPWKTLGNLENTSQSLSLNNVNYEEIKVSVLVNSTAYMVSSIFSKNDLSKSTTFALPAITVASGYTPNYCLFKVSNNTISLISTKETKSAVFFEYR